MNYSSNDIAVGEWCSRMLTLLKSSCITILWSARRTRTIDAFCAECLMHLVTLVLDFHNYKYLCRLAVRIGGRHGDRGNLSLLSSCLPHILFYPTGNRTFLDNEISPLAFLEFAPATFHRFSSHIHFAHLHRTFLTRQRQIWDGSLSLCT